MPTPRNALCPCGSGKKYKRCCGRDPRARVEPTEGERRDAVDRLGDFVYETRFQEHRRRAMELLWGPWVERLELVLLRTLSPHDEMHTAEYGLLALDLPLAGDGRTLAHILLDEHGAAIPPGERRALEELSDAPLELLEVHAEGKAMVLERSGVRFRDPALPPGLLPGEHLGARVVGGRVPRLVEDTELFDYPSRLSGDSAERLAGAGATEGAAFFHLWLEAHLAMFARSQAREGLRLGSWEMRFRLDDREALEEFLRLDYLDPIEYPDGLWCWPIPESDEPKCGLLLIDEELLIATATSRRAARVLRALLESVGIEHLETLKPEAGAPRTPHGESRYPYLHAHLPDYLDQGDLSIRVPREARNLGLYLGRIVAAASARAEQEVLPVPVACRRRPDHMSCSANLLARIDHGGRVLWECPRCGDAGTIVEWKGTAFDLRDRDVAEREEGGTVRQLSVHLRATDHTRLLRLVHLSAPALRTISSAAPDPSGGILFEGTREELVALQRCIAFHFARAKRMSDAEARVLSELHSALGELTGEPPDLSHAAQAAEVLLFERSRRRQRPRRSAPGGTHRLRVEIEDVAPPVARIVELSSSATLQDLYEALILAFCWSDTHLHVFEVGDRRIGVPHPEDWREVEDERDVLLADALAHPGDRMTWEYDFGDSWRHVVVAEEILPDPPARPRLLYGERAAPPEDCGGPPGYENLLAALADPEHEEHEELRCWAGEGFDPERCDVALLDARLARMEPRCVAEAPVP